MSGRPAARTGALDPAALPRRAALRRRQPCCSTGRGCMPARALRSRRHPARWLEGWALYHNGDFERAAAIGPAARRAQGLALANQATAIYANYLEPREAMRQALFRAGGRARRARRPPTSPTTARRSTGRPMRWAATARAINVARALAQGLGGKVKGALERVIALQPRHADAHIALAAFHADVIDKVGRAGGPHDLRRARRRPRSSSSSAAWSCIPALGQRADRIRPRPADAAWRGAHGRGHAPLRARRRTRAGRRARAARRRTGPRRAWPTDRRHVTNRLFLRHASRHVRPASPIRSRPSQFQAARRAPGQPDAAEDLRPVQAGDRRATTPRRSPASATSSRAPSGTRGRQHKGLAGDEAKRSTST